MIKHVKTIFIMNYNLHVEIYVFKYCSRSISSHILSHLMVLVTGQMVPIRHFQFTAYADVDTYVDTYADLKYRSCVSIFFSRIIKLSIMLNILVFHDLGNIHVYRPLG